MICRFSSTSKVFTVKQLGHGCEFSWQASLNLSQFKYMAVIDLYTSSWPTDGSKLCNLSSNLTESTLCNPNGFIFTWWKKPQNRAKGLKVYSPTYSILIFKNFIHSTGSSLMK